MEGRDKKKMLAREGKALVWIFLVWVSVLMFVAIRGGDADAFNSVNIGCIVLYLCYWGVKLAVWGIRALIRK